jgi:hypothetical protein
VTPSPAFTSRAAGFAVSDDGRITAIPEAHR